MKIVGKAKRKNKPSYREICHKCGTIYDFTIDELSCGECGYYRICCPECGYGTEIYADDFVTPKEFDTHFKSLIKYNSDYKDFESYEYNKEAGD